VERPPPPPTPAPTPEPQQPPKRPYLAAAVHAGAGSQDLDASPPRRGMMDDLLSAVFSGPTLEEDLEEAELELTGLVGFRTP
jgi:hypothetical protein